LPNIDLPSSRRVRYQYDVGYVETREAFTDYGIGTDTARFYSPPDPHATGSTYNNW